MKTIAETLGVSVPWQNRTKPVHDALQIHMRGAAGYGPVAVRHEKGCDE